MSSPDPRSQWRRLEAALDELLDLDPAGQRAALAKWRESDADFGAELENLLRHTAGDSNWLDSAAVAAVTDSEPPPRRVLTEGAMVGAYRIVRLVGRGGSGEVYEAERDDGHYRQQVALKVIHFEAIEHRHRFEAERQILANLNHANIARLLDGGINGDGQPYMVMEYVHGLALNAWCRTHQATLGMRLELFLQICDALSYAHRHFVVHRDLKPNNVFVTADGQVKLLDFGAAKLLGQLGSTETQHAPFTPGYAAPEQLSGGNITTATDVYALGLLLFELLAGAPPWAFDKLSMAAALEAALHHEAPRASDFAAQLDSPPLAPRALRGDFDAIVARALRKDPGHRYATVSELREDIVAHMEARPVKARGGALAYRLSRTLRRHKVLAASAVLLVLALAGGGIGIEHQARVAQAEARKEAAVKNFLLDVFRTNAVDNPDGVSARQTTAEQLLDRGAKALSASTTSTPEVRAELIDDLADLYDQLEDFDRVEQLERQRLRDLDHDGVRPSLARAASLAELGRALAMNVRYSEALPVLREALQELDGLHDTHSSARVLTLMTLGLVEYHVNGGADPRARRDTQEALDLLVRFQPDNPDRLTTVQLLARIDEQRQSFTAAEAGYREFLRLAQTPAFSGERVALGSAYEDLGNFLATQKHYDEGEAALRQAVQILDAAEGPDQMDALLAHLDLARLYMATARYDAAEPLLRQIAQVSSKDPTRTSMANDARLILAQLAAARHSTTPPQAHPGNSPTPVSTRRGP